MCVITELMVEACVSKFLAPGKRTIEMTEVIWKCQTSRWSSQVQLRPVRGDVRKPRQRT